MRLFQRGQYQEALQCSANGEQAILLLAPHASPPRRRTRPRRVGRRREIAWKTNAVGNVGGRRWGGRAMVLDRDFERLQRTALAYGAGTRAVVHAGQPNQHMIAFGKVLERLLLAAGAPHEETSKRRNVQTSKSTPPTQHPREAPSTPGTQHPVPF